MKDFDFIASIIHNRYLCKGNERLLMIEDKESTGKEQQLVRISFNERQIDRINLYRFDSETNKFLLFFNDGDNAPKGLNKFCDYIIMVERDDVLSVVLVELKRGGTDGHEQQLEAGRLFMKYILKTAERIKDLNKQELNIESVELRQVLIQPARSNKELTKRKDIELLDKNSVMKCRCFNEFRLIEYL
ncbi:MAG: hypothetical protein J1E99_05205 [Muribaculaceae bacterium]|nr:hypothetical protein [Muribaculaceae bacterium]